MPGNEVVTRFAPSPTGYLHVGGARTALFNWLLARHTGGRYLLRIEDTDLARSTAQSVTALTEDLRWLGLHWDNAELVYQSKRLDVYNRLIDDLMSRGLAYKAYETTEELDAQRKLAERVKRAYLYRRPSLTDARIREYEAAGRPHVIRFATPVQDYRFDDIVLGKDKGVDRSQVQDFVIRKTDGMPTYHFAVVVDDAAMGVTHVLRGQEHLLNTVNHIALQEALGFPRPAYGHLPVILNTSDGSKMGKRDRDKKVRHHAVMWLKNQKVTAAELAERAELPAQKVQDWVDDEGRQLDSAEQARVMSVTGLKASDLPEILVHDFRASGYLPEVLNNFLALLGWSPGGDRERMSMDDLIRLFSIDGIGKSNAKFNRDKLLAFNTEASAEAAPPRLAAAMRDYLSVNPSSPLNAATGEQIQLVLKMNAGFRTLREVDEKSQFFFIPDEELVYQPDAVEKVLHKNDGQGMKVLAEVRSLLATVEPWEAHSIESAVKAFCESRQLGLGKVAQPIRVSVSGSGVSPPIFESLALLGRSRTLARIGRCLDSSGAAAGQVKRSAPAQ